MLKQLAIKNPTVFPETDLQFAKHLNVIVGENGAGKTHLLKMAYAVLATSWDEGRKPAATAPTKFSCRHVWPISWSTYFARKPLDD